MEHAGTYDPGLVALSVLIAMFASYTALDLASRVPNAETWKRYAWLTAAALAMGGGIWAMHFVAMLSFTLPGMDISYDLSLTLFSLLLPIAVTCIGFFVASVPERGPGRLIISGVVMGLGVVAMHYTGMAAMRMQGSLHHRLPWVSLSVAIAISAAIIAIWLTFKRTNLGQRIAAALAMGVAISGMHYSAMRGAVFTYAAPMTSMGSAGVEQLPLALWIAGATVAILALGLVAAIYDRQNRIRAEREAAALRQIFETSHLYQWLLTKDGTIQYANKTALAGLQSKLDDVVDGTFWDTPWFTGTSGVPETVRKAVMDAAAGNVRSMILTLNLPIGARTFEYSFRPVRDQFNRITAIVPEAVDITLRLEAESQLRHAQKVEALGTLTGGIAHDFNNVLAAILGSLELLRKRLPPDENLLRFVDAAVAGAQRGAALSQRLLSFARRQDLNPTAVRLSDLVTGMSELLDRAVHSEAKLDICVDPELPAVFVDPSQLEMALLNLVVNARDASPAGGAITVGARMANERDTEGLGQGNYLCLYVQDRGQGMDEQTLVRAKDPFFTTKEPGKGTGLGLAMVHRLAEASGGKVVLKSRLGQGCTAEICLPIAKGTE